VEAAATPWVCAFAQTTLIAGCFAILHALCSFQAHVEVTLAAALSDDVYSARTLTATLLFVVLPETAAWRLTPSLEEVRIVCHMAGRN